LIEYRNAIHYIAGGISAWVATLYPVLGLGLIITFLVYEAMNDWRKEDWSYRDVLEFLIGLFVVAAGLSIWRYFK